MRPKAAEAFDRTRSYDHFSVLRMNPIEIGPGCFWTTGSKSSTLTAQVYLNGPPGPVGWVLALLVHERDVGVCLAQVITYLIAHSARSERLTSSGNEDVHEDSA